ncbi:unnamed protein product [Ilex paraguariensis]|uniref:Pathogenesis-related homeodomain protein n=1 Tax=Ilex paraguariensis TaxID=185542 RepID=A0ABC8UUW0_9AQUA
MNSNSSRRNVIKKASLHKSKSPKKQSSLKCQNEKYHIIVFDANDNGDLKPEKLKKRGKRKRSKDNVELDEASRLQRRTRYLLIKMKLEQNLIDAYSMEGWKGQSREKIKPENELKRAKKQILKCKLGIRDAIRQLDLLGSVGQIDDSAIAPDGSVYHEHIFCAKCKLREASPDNDIILCDGTCNCAFHQKCLDPPLSTENIPPGDQGWLCKFCDCKIEILEAMNAHIGTHFSSDSNWQDIFKEEAALPDGGDTLLSPVQEWPSDDSADDDYDPENFENSSSYNRVDSEDDASDDAGSSSGIWSLKGEVFSGSERLDKRSKGPKNPSAELIGGADSDETTACEILCGRRQRLAVDYKKLYDEMFGKDAPANEQISEDEDWGPTKRKRREKESDAASTLMTLCENDEKCHVKNRESEKIPSSKETKRPCFRIPPSAVEKLRLAFADNELPSRAVKENLSKQLGLESGKVSKWFKNARYLALRARKAGKAIPFHTIDSKMLKNSRSEIGKDKPADRRAFNVMSLANVVGTHTSLKKFRRRKNPSLLAIPLRRKQYKKVLFQSSANNKAAVGFDDDVTLKLIREKAKRQKKRVINFTTKGGVQEAEAEMERICKIKGKVEKLQRVLLGLANDKSNKGDAPTLTEISVVYVPVAGVREKR